METYWRRRFDKNMIPEMTDPLGKHWPQPKRSKILIDDTHALMDKETFDQLLEYSSSLPSGVYEGKMWKKAFGLDHEWQLGWYGSSDSPGLCSVKFRVILIV